MGIDEISSQPQGGRLAPADGGCIQRGKFVLNWRSNIDSRPSMSSGGASRIRKHQGVWAYSWKVFGSNAIFAYAFAELLSTMLEVIHVEDNRNAVSLKELIYTRIFSPIVNPSFGSLLYSLSYILFCFVPCLVLFRKRIFIKI